MKSNVNVDRADKCAKDIIRRLMLDESNAGLRYQVAGIVSSHYPDDRELLEAARALLTKIDSIESDPRYMAIWESAFIHGVRYEGPTWAVERERLRTAIERKG